jgi:ribosome assembly protein RRB1
MAKRTATEFITNTSGQPYPKASGSGAKRDDNLPNEMGEFEDAWEDEIESDEEVVDNAAPEEDGQHVLCFGQRRFYVCLINSWPTHTGSR